MIAQDIIETVKLRQRIDSELNQPTSEAVRARLRHARMYANGSLKAVELGKDDEAYRLVEIARYWVKEAYRAM